MKPVPGTPILRASVEAKRVSDLCTGAAAPNGARERWVEAPPSPLSDWPALRHARHLALRETHLTLPTVRHALGDTAPEAMPSPAELEEADAAWDPAAAIESAEAIVRGLGDTRFELLHSLEAAPDEAWERPLSSAFYQAPDTSAPPVQLDWLMLHARQHELEHVAAIWKVALYWDRVSPAAVYEPAAGLPLHPADRLEESH